MIPALIGMGIGMAGKAIGRAIANKKLRELEKNMPKYQENPLAKQQYALAQNMFNAQMPGTQEYLSGIERNKASTIAAAERGGQNSLLAASAATSQANEAGQALAGQQAAYKQSAYGNLSAANQNLISEQDKVYNDKLRQYQTSAQLQGARQENMQNTFGDIANLGMGLANFEAAGGFKGTSLQDLVGKKTPTTDNTVAQQQTLPLSTMGTFPGQGSMNLNPYGRMDLPPVNRVPGQMGMNLTPYQRMDLPPMDYYNQGLNNFFPYNTMRR